MRPQAQGLWMQICQPYGVWFFGNGNDLIQAEFVCVCAHSGLVLRLQYFVSRELAAEAMFTARRQFLNWSSGRILLKNLYKTESKILSPSLFK